MGEIIVLLVLAVVVFFAIRSLVKNHKSGGGCGDCKGGCGGCGCGCGDSCDCEIPELDEIDNNKKA